MLQAFLILLLSFYCKAIADDNKTPISEGTAIKIALSYLHLEKSELDETIEIFARQQLNANDNIFLNAQNDKRLKNFEKKLKNKKYWTISVGSPKDMLGRYFMVFVDQMTGEVICHIGFR